MLLPTDAYNFLKIKHLVKKYCSRPRTSFRARIFPRMWKGVELEAVGVSACMQGAGGGQRGLLISSLG